jgi:hypothetical protein
MNNPSQKAVAVLGAEDSFNSSVMSIKIFPKKSSSCSLQSEKWMAGKLPPYERSTTLAPPAASWLSGVSAYNGWPG